MLVDGDLKSGDVIVVEGVQGLRPGGKAKAAPRDAQCLQLSSMSAPTRAHKYQ